MSLIFQLRKAGDSGTLPNMATPALIRRGSKGEDVKTWQGILIKDPKPTSWMTAAGVQRQWPAGWKWPITADGDFGDRTQAATECWQARRGLSADGVVGPKTWGKALGSEVVPTPPSDRPTPVVLPVAGPEYPFVQAKNYTVANRTEMALVVIHDMEYPERPDGAEWCADFFAGRRGMTAPRASAHYCLAPETRVLCADLVWRPIGDVGEGHRLVATEEHTPGMSGRTLQQATITKAKRRESECLRITFNDGREVVCSLDHRWLVKPPLGGAPWEWRAAEALAEGWRLLAPMRPWEARSDRDAGYLEGIYDGEGCWSSNGDLSFAQKRGAVLDRAHGILNAAGIPYRLADQRGNGVVVTDLSGLQATMQALGQFRPRRLMHEPRWVGRALKSRVHSNHVTIASIECVGVREVVSIETSTHTFFAEGIVSHNCVDNDSIVQCVKEKDVAWHAPGANHNGIGIEHAGYARQSREEWLDAYSTAALKLSAKLVADICRRWDIPVVRLSPADLKAGKKGICGHKDVTDAFSNGKGHYDPGPGFPWDVYIEWIKEAG